MLRRDETRFSIIRYIPLAVAFTATILSLFFLRDHHWLWPVVAGAAALTLLGVYDLLQRSHSLRRNYPIIANFRWLFESIRPQIRQYLIEGDNEQSPFSRSQRSLVYGRAKDEGSERAFGTQLDVYGGGYEFMAHSTRPAPCPDLASFRIGIGGDQCAQALFSLDFQHLGAELRLAERERDPRAQQGGKAWRLRPRYRRRQHQPLSRTAWRRSHLGDRQRLFRMPDGRRQFRSGRVRAQSRVRAGQDDRDQAQPGRQAGSWRHSAGGQGDARDLRHARRAHGRGLPLTRAPPRLLDSARDDAFHCRAEGALGRQAGRVQVVRRAIPGSSWRSSRRCGKRESFPISSWSTAPRAAPAHRRSSS